MRRRGIALPCYARAVRCYAKLDVAKQRQSAVNRCEGIAIRGQAKRIKGKVQRNKATAKRSISRHRRIYAKLVRAKAYHSDVMQLNAKQSEDRAERCKVQHSGGEAMLHAAIHSKGKRCVGMAEHSTAQAMQCDTRQSEATAYPSPTLRGQSKGTAKQGKAKQSAAKA